MTKNAAVFIHGFMEHPREHQIIKELIESIGIETYNLFYPVIKVEK